MKNTWKVKHVSGKSLPEFSVMMERALNELEEDEFHVVKIEDIKIPQWDQQYQTVIIASKQPPYFLGPAGTTIVTP